MSANEVVIFTGDRKRVNKMDFYHEHTEALCLNGSLIEDSVSWKIYLIPRQVACRRLRDPPVGSFISSGSSSVHFFVLLMLIR